MRSCPRNGECERCSNVMSMAVGNSQRDRVFTCRLGGVKLGYDGRYGNRPVPLYQVIGSCFGVRGLSVPSTVGGR